MPDGSDFPANMLAAMREAVPPSIITLCDQIVEADRQAAQVYFSGLGRAATNDERNAVWREHRVATARLEELLRQAATVPAYRPEELAAKARVMLTWCGIWDGAQQNHLPEFGNNAHQLFGWWFSQDMIAAAAAQKSPCTTLESSDATPLMLEAARAFMDGERRVYELLVKPGEDDATEVESAAAEDIRREQAAHMTVMAHLRSAGPADIELKARVLDTFVADNLGPYANPLNCDGLTRSLLNDHLVTKLERHPDAVLLHLGSLFEAAWRAESAAYAVFQDYEESGGTKDDTFEKIHGQRYTEVAELIDQIEALPALTLQGLRIKARAFEWLNEGEAVNGKLLANRLIGSTDVALAAGIVRDLLALGDAA